MDDRRRVPDSTTTDTRPSAALVVRAIEPAISAKVQLEKVALELLDNRVQLSARSRSDFEIDVAETVLCHTNDLYVAGRVRRKGHAERSTARSATQSLARTAGGQQVQPNQSVQSLTNRLFGAIDGARTRDIQDHNLP